MWLDHSAAAWSRRRRCWQCEDWEVPAWVDPRKILDGEDWLNVSRTTAPTRAQRTTAGPTSPPTLPTWCPRRVRSSCSAPRPAAACRQWLAFERVGLAAAGTARFSQNRFIFNVWMVIENLAYLQYRFSLHLHFSDINILKIERKPQKYVSKKPLKYCIFWYLLLFECKIIGSYCKVKC